jgi:hypothetical protein
MRAIMHLKDSKPWVTTLQYVSLQGTMMSDLALSYTSSASTSSDKELSI